jgi:hypothetical protein
MKGFVGYDVNFIWNCHSEREQGDLSRFHIRPFSMPCCTEHLKVFVERAVINAQQTHHFEQEWLRLKVRLTDVSAAWEQGRAAFKHDFARVTGNQEEMDYFSVIDFASNCYTVAAAQSTYQDDQAFKSGSSMAI